MLERLKKNSRGWLYNMCTVKRIESHVNLFHQIQLPVCSRVTSSRGKGIVMVYMRIPELHVRRYMMSLFVWLPADVCSLHCMVSCDVYKRGGDSVMEWKYWLKSLLCHSLNLSLFSLSLSLLICLVNHHEGCIRFFFFFFNIFGTNSYG